MWVWGRGVEQGVTVIDSHLLVQGHNYKLQLSPWKQAVFLWWHGVAFRGTIWSHACMCLWGYSVALTDQLSFNKAYHTHTKLFPFSPNPFTAAQKLWFSPRPDRTTGILMGETQNITFLNRKWLCFSSGTGKVSFRLSHISKVSECMYLIDWVCMTMCVRCVIYDVISEISPHPQRPEATERQHVQPPPP